MKADIWAVPSEAMGMGYSEDFKVQSHLQGVQEVEFGIKDIISKH